MSFGIDYASVDGNAAPDFDKLKAAGASFVWIRAAYADWDSKHRAWYLGHDSAFQRDWARLGASGLVRGAYWIVVPQASQSPEEQVANFASAVQATGGFAPGDFAPCIDIEFPRGIAGTVLSRPELMRWLRRAIAEMRRIFGCWPIIYTSARVWNDTDTDCLGDPPAPDLVECTLWLARYLYATRQPAVIPPPATGAPPVPHPWGAEYLAWQDQGDALGVPGFTATADIDRLNTAKLGDRGGYIAWAQRKLGITADGDYGPNTQSAVRVFQTAHGLVADGVLGVKTAARLSRLP